MLVIAGDVCSHNIVQSKVGGAREAGIWLGIIAVALTVAGTELVVLFSVLSHSLQLVVGS